MNAGSMQNNRLVQCFTRLKDDEQKALVTYVTAGYPAPAQTVEILHSLVEGGADVIELGLPFSDPMADGPVIQQASEQALAAGTTTATVLELVREFRGRDDRTPVVIMTYLNPVEAMGYEQFTVQAAAAGVDGLLVVDLPPEEADDLRSQLNDHELCEIFLIAPTTSSERLDMIDRYASGFVYYVSVKGVTGSGEINIDEVAGQVEEIKRHTDLPIGVGFAIHDAATAGRVAAISDAVIIGSAILNRIGQVAGADRPNDELASFIGDLRKAIDTVPA